MTTKVTAREFIAQIAAMTKDGECLSCNQDGNEPNPNCPGDHEPWDMPNDDAVDTVHSLISAAREMLAEEPEPEPEPSEDDCVAGSDPGTGRITIAPAR